MNGQQGSAGYRDGAGNLREAWREVSFREACGFYRLSEKTLRKRLREGIVPGRLRYVNGREEWVVQLPPEEVPAANREPAEDLRGAAREDAGNVPGSAGEEGAFVPGEVPAHPPGNFPTRDDILSLIREQLAADRTERESLRQENQQLAGQVGALSQALRDQTRALELGHEETRVEVTALAARVGEIDTRGRELSRRGRVTAAMAVVLALLCAVMGGMLLTRTAPSSTRADRAGPAPRRKAARLPGSGARLRPPGASPSPRIREGSGVPDRHPTNDR